LKILSLGITIKVSTASFIFVIHSSALASLLLHSKLNGFVMIATVNIPIAFAMFAITGAAPVHVHPHIPQVMKTISVS